MFITKVEHWDENRSDQKMKLNVRAKVKKSFRKLDQVTLHTSYIVGTPISGSHYRYKGSSQFLLDRVLQAEIRKKTPFRGHMFGLF